MRSTWFLARFWLSLVFDVEVVTSKQLSATLRLIGHRWTSLLSRSMTQSTILNSTSSNNNIVTQLIRKIKARVSSQQKENPVKIPVQRSQSIYLNPSVNGLCQNCSYKLMTECRAHDTVIMSQVNILDPQIKSSLQGGARGRGRGYPGHLARSQVVRRHSDMGLVRARPGPEAFITFRGRETREDGGEETERANEEARRLWLNKMRNRMSRYK